MIATQLPLVTIYKNLHTISPLFNFSYPEEPTFSHYHDLFPNIHAPQRAKLGLCCHPILLPRLLVRQDLFSIGAHN